MIVGSSGCLKQVGSFIRFFRLCTSQNVGGVSSLSAQLKYPTSIIFSYCDDSESIYFSISSRQLDIAVLCGLQRETISFFLLRRLISNKKHSLFPELNFELKSFDGSPSLMKRISLPPFRSLSNLYGLEYHSMLNAACAKDEPSFVSDSINISILSLNNGTKSSNLFHKELKQLSLKMRVLKFCQDQKLKQIH